MSHDETDLDSSVFAGHHSLGPKAHQAAPGNHKHMQGITVTGSRGGNAALADLITKLADALGFTDGTTP